jgi:uridine kinase
VRVEKLRDLIARLHALPRRRLTLLIAVDGLRGAGKTTFTRALSALDPGLDVLQMDEFVLPEAESEVSDGRGPMDWRRLRSQVLLPLSRDQPARYQRYDPALAALGEWRLVPVGGIVIIEGLYSCLKALAMFYDFRIWVDAPGEVRLKRCPGSHEAEETYLAGQGPAAAAHLRVDGSGREPHDLSLEYVRLS